MKKIAIIGGGINGIAISYFLSSSGNKVDLYEKNKCLEETSSKSTKLLHGGIRYLEHGNLFQVYNSLQDRKWWFDNAPDLCKIIEINCPVYKKSKRGTLTTFLGTRLYDFLSLNYTLGRSKMYSKSQAINKFPELEACDLKGVITFFDLQMKENALGQWLLEKSRSLGTNIHENVNVKKVSTDGTVHINKKKSFTILL